MLGEALGRPRPLQLQRCSLDHMRLQPRSHAGTGTLPGAACLESLERANQSDNFELETHWRMLVIGGGAGAGTLASPAPARCALYLRFLRYLRHLRHLRHLLY